MKAAVVPEKYRSASADAQGGNHSGSFSAGRRISGSGVMPQHRPQISFENRRRLFELVGEPGQMLQLADRLLRLAHAFGGGVDLTAEEIRVLPIDRHLGERLNFSLDAIELDRDEIGVLPGTAVVVEAQLAHGDAVLKRLQD